MTDRRIIELPTNCDEDGNPLCPFCGCNKSEVLNTYPWKNGFVRRRRECDHCGLPFFTRQRAEESEEE